jgi:glycosyltransferase involved in cell wall biosynthesis
MSSNSLVSVIMIFLNEERFIQEAIESVLAQTYDNWELLLVDDGSTDGSTDIAQHYVSHYPGRMHYLEHPNHRNRGMSASRNLGLGHAKGGYLAFLDGDDVWLPHKLERQVTIMASQPEAAMVYGKTEYWYSWTASAAGRRRDFVQHHGIEANTLYRPPLLLTLFLGRKAAIPCVCSVLMRRKFLQRTGGFEEDFPGLYEDQVSYAKVCLEAPVFVSEESWDRYRQHSQSYCSTAENAGQILTAHRTYLTWLAGYLSKRGHRNTEVWQALQRELWLYRHSTGGCLPAEVRSLVRWTKTWLLRLEELILPPGLRRWLWTREQLPE